jgi:hypothetical protein
MFPFVPAQSQQQEPERGLSGNKTPFLKLMIMIWKIGN